MTSDGLMCVMDIAVTRGTGEARDHTPSVLNNQSSSHLATPLPGSTQPDEHTVTKQTSSSRIVPPTGMIPFDDGSQELSLGPDNVPTDNLSDELQLLSLHDMIEASKANAGTTSYMMNGYGESRMGDRESSASVEGGRARKKGLEFVPANLDLIDEGAPTNQLNNKWYQDSDYPYMGSLPPSLAQEGSGKVEDAQSSTSDTNLVNSSPPIESRPRTRSQSSLQKASMSTSSSETHFLSGGRTGLTSSMTALDHLSLGRRSRSTDLGNIRIKRKGRNSLEALTKIGGDLRHGGSSSSSAIKRHRSDENTRRVKPLPQRSVAPKPDKQDELDKPAWMQGQQRSNRTSNQAQPSEGESYSTQLSGSDHHGSAPRLAHSVSTEAKGRRARSYQSQRAKLHSSRSAIKISSSQDLTDSLEHHPARSRRSVDRSDTSLEGSTSQDRSIQSDETLVENRPTNVQPAQPVLPVVRVEQQQQQQGMLDVVPSKVSGIGRHRSLKESQQKGPVVRVEREREKKTRPLSAVESPQFRHAALQGDGSAHNVTPGQDSKIPLYKTRSGQTPYGVQQFREVNIEEAIARSQMTQEGVELEGHSLTGEPVKSEALGNKSKRKEFGKKIAVSYG